jgi:hypothetical protein
LVSPALRHLMWSSLQSLLAISFSLCYDLLRTGAFEDRWMVAPGCDVLLTTWCGLTPGRVLQVQVAALFELVQVKSEWKGLCLAGLPRSEETSWLDLRDPVASGV